MARATIQAYNINAQSLTGLTIAQGAGPGVDATGTGTGYVSWASVGSPLGVQFINNGQMFLLVSNGATPTAANVLVGRKGGGPGGLPAFNQAATTITIGASASNLVIGPLSVQDFTQQDSTQYSGAPGGVIGAGGVGYTCIDFTNTTTLTVRLYQLITATP